jgi:site-specific recombinase XerD
MNPNPFAHIAISIPPQNKDPKPILSKQSLADVFMKPLVTSPRGLRDLALLHLLVNGMTIRQLHHLDLSDIDEKQGVVVVKDRNEKLRVIILEPEGQSYLSRWIMVRRLFSNNTDAVFISLHWTSGRATPGQRISERGIRLAVAKYLHSKKEVLG